MTDTKRTSAPWLGTQGAALVVLALVAGLLQPARASGQAGAFASDDFNRGELGPEWTVENPLEDGRVALVGGGSGDARLELAVPEGVNHEPWDVNRSVRVMRDAQDTDFTAVARFQSVPTQRYQMQGILVRQDDDDWIRFEVHHNGTELRAFAGTTTGRSTTKRLDRPATTGALAYVQVARTGDTWVLSTSPDGALWEEAGTFDLPMNVSEIGVFAGNADTNPGFTAVVDYLFEASAPIDPEDGGPGAGDLTLELAPAGPGAISRSPDKAAYVQGEQVTLTAISQPGAVFGGWGGDMGGGDNPLVVTMDGDTSVAAAFAPDSTPPAVEGLTVQPSASSAVIRWTTDEVATTSVTVGPTEAYEYGSYGTDTPATTHAITVPGLRPGIRYHFRVNATNVSGLTSTSIDYTFLTAVAPSVAFDSDDFNREALEPKSWAVVDPLGAGGVALDGAGGMDARLNLAVPAGAPRDANNVNNSLRVMEPAADIDFTAEIKLEALPSENGQAAGLLIQQDANNWARFDVRHDGTNLRAHAASTANGVTTPQVDDVWRVRSTAWLRVARADHRWELRTSSDGASWEEVGSFQFPIAVNEIGPFAATSGDPAPAFTAQVDYVFEGSAPVAPEDQPESAVMRTIEVEGQGDGEGTVQRIPDQDEYVAGTEVRLVAVPSPGSAFTGWGGELTGADNPVDVVLEDDMTIEAGFASDTTPPTLSEVSVQPSTSSAVVRWTTDEPASSSVAVGTSAAYELGSFGSPYRTRHHAVTVTGLNPGATYHFAPSSSDAAAHVSVAPDGTFSTAAGGAPTFSLWYGDRLVVGQHGRSQTWVNVNGNASDPDGVTSLSYSLNGGEERPLSAGADLRRLQQPGDFNAEVPFDELEVGENQVRLTAYDTNGQSSSATVTVERVEGEVELPYETDWSEANRLHDQAQPVDGRWTTDGDTVRPAEYGYDRVLAIGDTSWHDYEVTFPVSVSALGPGAGSHLSGPALVGFAMNWQGHTPVEGEQPGYFWYPTGALAWYRWYSPAQKLELRGNMDSPIARQSRVRLTFGQTYMFKGRSETVDEGVRYSWKVWPEGAPEPSGWTLSVTEDDGPATGSVALIAHHADAHFGNVTVRPIDS